MLQSHFMYWDHSSIPTIQSSGYSWVFFPFFLRTFTTFPTPKPGMLDPGLTGSRQDLAPEIQVLRRGSTLIQIILTTACPSTMLRSSVSPSVRVKQERSSGKSAEGKSFRTNFLNFIDMIINKPERIKYLKAMLLQKNPMNVHLLFILSFLISSINKILMMERGQNTPDYYIYQMRRPRPANPTYNSSSVSGTCFSLYHGGPLDHPSPPQHQGNSAHNELKQEFTRSRGVSQLSNIGSSLLRADDKDIYNRQRSRYDIISMGEVNQDETIKKYPKFTLEDKDVNYLRRMGKLVKDSHGANGPNSDRKKVGEGVLSKDSTAGRHTYEMDSNKTAVELWESYQGKPPIQPRFTAKMLNHADQFRSLM